MSNAIKNKKRILLIGYNYAPEPTGIGKYSGEMMHWLANEGYTCGVITAYPYYPYWKVQEPFNKKKYWYSKQKKMYASGGSTTIYRCPMYIPEEPSGLKRICLDISFMASAFFRIIPLFFGKKYHAIITVVPSFQFGLLGYFYKAFTGSKLLYHIQDMQIEAAQDLNMITSKPLINSLLSIERFIFKKSDIISTISEKMVQKVEEKTKKNVVLFPNWTDTNFFSPITDTSILKKEFGFKDTDKIILYSGAIGEKQGLEAIIYAAENYKNEEHFKFVICGSGPYKEKLQNLSNDLDLTNVVFFPLQPMEKFNQFLNSADVHLVIQKAKASDLVMPSKLTTILSVGGVALITANPDSGLYTLINKYDMGVLVAAESQKALNEGIGEALSTNLRKQYKENARKYAEDFLEINSVMKTYETYL